MEVHELVKKLQTVSRDIMVCDYFGREIIGVSTELSHGDDCEVTARLQAAIEEDDPELEAAGKVADQMTALQLELDACRAGSSARVEELLDALRKFARHKGGCGTLKSRGFICNCGLNAAGRGDDSKWRDTYLAGIRHQSLEMKKSMQNSLAVLACIVKHQGGEVRVPESVADSLHPDFKITPSHDPETKETVFLLEEPL